MHGIEVMMGRLWKFIPKLIIILLIGWFLRYRVDWMMRLLSVLLLSLIALLNSYVLAQSHLEIPVSKQSRNELILKRSSYTLSFNKETNIPNWVAWQLDKKKLTEQKKWATL